MTTLKHKGVTLTLNENTGKWTAEGEGVSVSEPADLVELKKKVEKLLEAEAKVVTGWASKGYGVGRHSYVPARVTVRPGQKERWITFLNEAGEAKGREKLHGSFYPDTPENVEAVKVLYALEDEAVALQEKIREAQRKLVAL